MSSLWTPGGEVPMNRDTESQGNQPSPEPKVAAPGPPSAPEPGTPEEEAMREQIAAMQQHLLQAPASDVVVEHCAGLYELAALHLSQPEPKLGDAKLAIDALSSLVGGLEGRLGPAEKQLRDVLDQLRLAFVQRADQSGAAPGAPAPPEAG